MKPLVFPDINTMAFTLSFLETSLKTDSNSGISSRLNEFTLEFGESNLMTATSSL